MPYPTKKLGEITKIVGGGTPSTKNESYWGSGHFWATPRDLAQLKITDINSTARTITEFGLEHSSAELLPVGSVILSSRAPIGYVAITTELMAINQGCRAFICGDEVNNRYLYYFLLISKKYLQSLGRGATFTEINKSTLEKIEIPLPPIATQKQIVERLDKIAEAQKLNDELIQKTEELFQSLLHKELNPAGPADAKAMAGKKDWEVKTIGDVCKIIGGGTPSREELKHFKGDIPWVTVKDLNILEIEDALEHINKESLKNSAANLVPADTILVVTRVGLGKVAITKKPLTFNQDIKGLIAGDGIDPRYLFYSILNIVPIIVKNGKGATVKGITQEFLKKIEISIPPLKTQKQIAAKLSAVQDYKKQLLGQKVKLKELFDSTLARSMKS